MKNLLFALLLIFATSCAKTEEIAPATQASPSDKKAKKAPIYVNIYETLTEGYPLWLESGTFRVYAKDASGNWSILVLQKSVNDMYAVPQERYISLPKIGFYKLEATDGGTQFATKTIKYTGKAQTVNLTVQ